jgi:hypothetical protein
MEELLDLTELTELTELGEFVELAELAELAELRWTKCLIAEVPQMRLQVGEVLHLH